MTNTKRNIFQDVDWATLLFLIGITYVKLYVKLAAICFYLVWLIYKEYKTTSFPGFSRFYFLMPVIGIVTPLLNGSFNADGYMFGYAMGVVNWLLAGVASYFLCVAVVNNPVHKLRSTVKVFFLFNALFSFGELGRMMIDSGQLVPYWYWEPTEYYGGSTGDHVKGLFSNISVANATANAIGVIYFVYHKELKWAILCVLVLLLCTSNLTLILLLLFLFAMLVLLKERKAKMQVLAVLAAIGIVYPILSLNNIKYVGAVYTQETERKKEKETQPTVAKKVMQPEIGDFSGIATAGNYYLHKESYFKLPLNDSQLISYKDDLKYLQQFGSARSRSNDNLHLEPAVLRSIIEKWYGIPYAKTPLAKDPGLVKLYTGKQTLNYLKSSMKHLLFGAGVGNFSSKQAIKSTGLGLQGNYPTKYIYVSSDFLQYHLYSLMFVFSMPISEHSIINMPNSIYNQLAGEYGLAGIAAFIIFYIGYIWKNRRSLKASRYIIPLVFLFFGFEYWFEMISLTALFELIIFIDIYKQDEPTA